MLRRTLLPVGVALLVALPACTTIKSWFGAKPVAPAPPPPVKVHSFSDTLPATALVGVDNTLWVGTPRGLLKWDVPARSFALLTKNEGLPADRIGALAPDGTGGVWVMTSAGLAHMSKGAWANSPAVPIGDFVTGLVQTADGSLWAGGPEGLGRLTGAKWDRFLGSASVTALATTGNNELWVGTSGRGVVRIVSGMAMVYGPEQGLEMDVVRGLAATGGQTLIALGKTPGEQHRLALWDGKRFHSYKIEAPAGMLLEWVRRIGNETLVGAGADVFVVGRSVSGSEAPVKLMPVAVQGKRKLPAVGPATGEIPEAKSAAAQAASAPAPAPDPKAAKKSKQPAKPEPPKDVDEDAGSDSAPALEVARWETRLPEGVTAVGGDGPVLYVGTRFLGAARVSTEGVIPLRTADLAQSAVRLSVACEGPKDCYVATGGPRAWHFDGESFDPTTVDPEPGSRVLAVINMPSGGVLAVHRGGKDPTLRLSAAASGNWTPIGVQEVQVPEGSPEITFARYAPDRHLWLGLQYIDKVGDRVDYGAAEVLLDAGKVIYHRRFSAAQTRDEGHGTPLPNDIEAACFVSADEAWFGTHSGAAHLKGGQVRLYTENDGLESEFIRDVLQGPDQMIWVATSRGIGRFDGTRWTFPAEGDTLRTRATSLGLDRRGIVYIGTNDGVLIKGPTGYEKLDEKRGLLDNKVLNLSLDYADRVWVLTEKGLTIVDR